MRNNIELLAPVCNHYVENDPTMDDQDKAVRKGFMDESLKLGLTISEDGDESD